MADIFDKKKRSLIMSKVKSQNTKPELILRKALFSAGLRGYRLKVKLPGSPDLVFSKAKVAIFVDGCFWHGCPECYSAPKDNEEFWRDKLIENKERDVRSNEKLVDLGWEPLRFWEHQVEKELDSCVKRVEDVINIRKKKPDH